jgi:hypothetical protein
VNTFMETLNVCNLNGESQNLVLVHVLLYVLICTKNVDCLNRIAILVVSCLSDVETVDNISKVVGCRLLIMMMLLEF